MSSSQLPNDLLTEILCRVPVKSLIRFKCLSKPLCCLLDDPDFARLHLQHSSNTNTNLKLLLDNTKRLDDMAYSVDLDSLSNLVHIPRPFPAEANKYASRIIGSHNGILAVYHCRAGIALWNPSTRDHRYQPPLPDLITMDHYDRKTVLGFGYDLVNHDYKVVKMLRSKTQNCYNVMVYSLKSNSWKRIKDCPYDFYNDYRDGAYLNGSLHWVGDGRMIFALDLTTEEYHELPTDGDRGMITSEHPPNYRYMNEGVLGGCLWVSLSFDTCQCDLNVNIWVMKEYGVKESWTKLMYLRRDNRELTNLAWSRAVAYSRNGDKVLLDDGGWHQCVWFDLQDETAETLCIPGALQLFSTMIYVESLVSVNQQAGSGSICDFSFSLLLVCMLSIFIFLSWHY